MAFLAALAVGGAAGAAAVAARWQAGVAAAVTVQLPAETDAPRLAAALAALRALPGVAEARATDPARLAALLRPWIGGEAGGLPATLRLPVVVELRLRDARTGQEAERVAAGVPGAVPGAIAAAHADWVARLVALARSLGALAWAVLGLVGGAAVLGVATAVRAGIAGAREAIGILHDLGAGDADIAGRFADRAAVRVGLGAALGALAALPVLAWLGALAGPLIGGGGAGAEAATAGVGWGRLPWLGLVTIPVLGAALGWVTAQVTVRLWLRQLP